MLIAIPLFILAAILLGVALAAAALWRPHYRATLVWIAVVFAGAAPLTYGAVLILSRIAPQTSYLALPVIVVASFLLVVGASFGTVYGLLAGRSRAVGAAALIGVVLSVAGAHLLWGHFQCRVTITNRSGHALSDCRLTLNGPSVDIGAIPDGGKRTIRIHPQGESSVTLTFKGLNGREGRGGAGYVEANGYHVRLSVGPNDEVTEKTGLR
jgi:hypothetical protein